MVRYLRRLAVFALLLAGCGMAGGESLDTGRRAPADGGAEDTAGDAASSPSDFSSDPIYADRSSMDLAGTPAEPSGAFGDDADGLESSCYDLADNDGNALADCADPGCASLPSCKVGNTESCLAEAQIDIDFISCEGLTVLTDCLPTGARVFGDPDPWVAGGFFHPGGDETFDSGLVIGNPVDLTTHRVDLSATFSGADCGGEVCIEGAGVGYVGPVAFDDSTYVRPVVGLYLNGARNEVDLILAGERVKSWPLEDDGQQWAVTLRPTGEVTVTKDGAAEMLPSRPFVPVRAATLVIYGRNHNPTGGTSGGASIGELHVTPKLCDMPGSWEARQPISVRHRAMVTPYQSDHTEGASIAYDDVGDVAFAFADEDNGVHKIFTARRGGAVERNEFTMAHDTGTPALVGAHAHDEGGVRDPELMWDGTRWVVYYTAQAVDGALSIGRAVTTDGSLERLTSDEAAVIRPADHPDIEAFEMPTVARTQGYDDPRYVMIVRATLNSGVTTKLIPFSSTDGQSWTRFVGSDLETWTSRNKGSAGLGFDADEISSPSLMVRNGAFHLYYAGRRGTRWSLGLLVSDSVLYWRQVDEGARVLRASDQLFERVGVMDPDVTSRGTHVELVYSGWDGARTTLAHTQREARGE